ncbi:Rossmann-like domain-containing protein [Saccharopolyspora taberi]|uniref:Rossmann-like domain-containing protein n=1 Tax=Saccharopolyspora taberi TaxID=60895 RepID=UPI0031E18443
MADRVRAADPDRPAEARLDHVRTSVAFMTVQSAHHVGRSSGYANSVLSLRIGGAIGSCAVEPGELDPGAVRDLVGRNVAELLEHPEPAVRVAVLDAYLAFLLPHTEHPGSRTVRVPGGTSLAKSTARAREVAKLVPLAEGDTVAVIGVVNSLLAALRERGARCVPCDLKGGRTEWDEPIVPDHRQAMTGAQAVLASGMVLGNGTFDEISAFCREQRLPLVLFAQTGSAVLRELLGADVHALSAEPYPFFWLTGDSTDIHLYAAETGERP